MVAITLPDDTYATRTLDDFWAISARVEPDFRDLLLGELVHHTDADLWWNVDRGHVDRAGNVEYRRIGAVAFDFALVRVDRHDGVALVREGTQRLVAELSTISRSTDDGDGFGHKAVNSLQSAVGSRESQSSV